jgi:UPF0755 protein
MLRFLRLVLRAAVAIAVVLAALAAAAWWWIEQPLRLPASPYAFDVKAGASLRSVARDLAAAGVLPNALPLVALARLQGVDRAIKAGNYELSSGVTLPRLLAKLVQGDATQAALTLVEGTTYAGIKRALAAQSGVTRTVLDLPEAELMKRLGADSVSAEGWFFPETYFFSVGSTDVAILARAYKLMRGRLDAAWAQRAPDLPLKDAYEALILASIVETVTGSAADRPLIASVFLNRLKLGMRLQTDPAVIYGLGERFDGNLRKRDLEADTPYNTYTRDGLPPTPIAMPGLGSLYAALHPAATDALYFVAKGDGSSHFSKSLEEHDRAVTKYQKNGKR